MIALRSVVGGGSRCNNQYCFPVISHVLNLCSNQPPLLTIAYSHKQKNWKEILVELNKYRGNHLEFTSCASSCLHACSCYAIFPCCHRGSASCHAPPYSKLIHQSRHRQSLRSTTSPSAAGVSVRHCQVRRRSHRRRMPTRLCSCDPFLLRRNEKQENCVQFKNIHSENRHREVD